MITNIHCQWWLWCMRAGIRAATQARIAEEFAFPGMVTGQPAPTGRLILINVVG
jgi:hypothetical protein